MTDQLQRVTAAMTVIQGDAGAPPHRNPGVPCFGYIMEGEVPSGEAELEDRKDRRVAGSAR